MLLRDAILQRLQPVLDEYARELSSATGATVQTGSSFNDAFILRAYVEAYRTGDSEVALTVDVRDREGTLTVESRIVRDDGIYKEGPELSVGAKNQQLLLASFAEWLTQLEDYMRVNRQYFIDLLR